MKLHTNKGRLFELDNSQKTELIKWASKHKKADRKHCLNDVFITDKGKITKDSRISVVYMAEFLKETGKEFDFCDALFYFFSEEI